MTRMSLIMTQSSFMKTQFNYFQLDPPDNVNEIMKNGVKAWTVERGIDITEFQESVEWDLMSVVGTKHMNFYPCCDYP